MIRRLCAGHEYSNPVDLARGVQNTVAVGTAPNLVVLQLVQRFGLSGRGLVIGIDDGLATVF